MAKRYETGDKVCYRGIITDHGTVAETRTEGGETVYRVDWKSDPTDTDWYGADKMKPVL